MKIKKDSKLYIELKNTLNILISDEVISWYKNELPAISEKYKDKNKLYERFCFDALEQAKKINSIITEELYERRDELNDAHIFTALKSIIPNYFLGKE